VVDKPKAGHKRIIKRVFTKRKIEIFKSYLEEELWEDTYLQKEVNRSYNTFLNKFLYYFHKAFPQ